MWNFESSAMIVLDKRIGAMEIDSKSERLLREVVHNNMILFKYSGLLKLSFPFYKVRNICLFTSVGSKQKSLAQLGSPCLSKSLAWLAMT